VIKPRYGAQESDRRRAPLRPSHHSLRGLFHVNYPGHMRSAVIEPERPVALLSWARSEALSHYLGFAGL